MLAGRKLLLADDSITIQKVVDLTFADEGVSVVCVNNGRDAIERLKEFAPDVVLADVFMPQVNGYEVCEYIKQNEKLKHIPVMLLVGSFEPFDEEEARRVGANDTLTKPFQSIRRLIEKVGLLTSQRPPEEQIPTAELPKPEGTDEPEVERLSTDELAISTADTLRMPPGLRSMIEEGDQSKPKQEAEIAMQVDKDDGMENKGMETRGEVFDAFEGAGDVLLDLGELDSDRSIAEDDFVLDLDLDEVPDPSPVEPAFQAAGFRPRDTSETVASTEPAVLGPNWSVATPAPAATPDQLAITEEFSREIGGTAQQRASEQYSTAASVPATGGSPQQLSPEIIDAIARRVVEQLSEKVVQEIAWEVVPQLAELLIKRQLEEKSS